MTKWNNQLRTKNVNNFWKTGKKIVVVFVKKKNDENNNEIVQKVMREKGKKGDCAITRDLVQSDTICCILVFTYAQKCVFLYHN